MKIAIFNPLPHDFSFVRLNDNNEEETLVIPSQDMVFYDKPIAEFMGKHLIDVIYHHREHGLYDEEALKEIKKEVFIEI